MQRAGWSGSRGIDNLRRDILDSLFLTIFRAKGILACGGRIVVHQIAGWA